jgi:hypothetical protein
VSNATKSNATDRIASRHLGGGHPVYGDRMAVTWPDVSEAQDFGLAAVNG